MSRLLDLSAWSGRTPHRSRRENGRVTYRTRRPALVLTGKKVSTPFARYTCCIAALAAIYLLFA